MKKPRINDNTLRGRNHFVIIFSRIGLVFKFPRISVTTFELKGDGVIRKYSKKVFLANIADNWREFLFYQRTHHCFLQPTYLSLLGLVNFQRFGVVCEEKSFWSKLLNIIFETKKEKEEFYNRKIGDILLQDIHHWQFSINFSFWKGRLYIHDYGSLKTQKAILIFGEKIAKNFSSH